MTLLNTYRQKFLDRLPSIEEENNVRVLLAYIRGSHMYGTATANSDVDITFVYQQPTEEILKENLKDQINLDKDTVGFEISKFLHLLNGNNPNVLEALDIPEDCLIYKDDCMNKVLDEKVWLSKLTKNTILGYASSQVAKATGLNKKMNKPVENKSITDFCYIIFGSQSMPLTEFLKIHGVPMDKCGIVNIDHGRDLYGLYIDFENTQNFRGIVKNEEENNLRLSSIPKKFAENNLDYTLFYNKDAHSVWRKEYNSYQQWLQERNEERYTENMEHGKSYDLKNMMHLFRLLNMAFRISMGEGLHVREEDPEWLLEIRRGEIEYEELTEYSEMLFDLVRSNYKTVDLIEKPDSNLTKELLYGFRIKDWYPF